MIGGDRRPDLSTGGADILDADFRREMFEHDLQARKLLRHGNELALDEDSLPVEDIDGGVNLLAMDQQAHVDLFHARQHPLDELVIGDARRRIGGGVGGIELHRREDALLEAALDVIGVGVIGEIAGDQRREGGARRQGPQRPLAIGCALRCGAHGRQEIGHEDRAAEIARGIGQHGAHHLVVAHMQVPVVGFADGQPLGHDAVA